MIALSLAFLLYLASSPAWALQSDVAETLSSRLVAQERSIEQELSGYLDQDDIAGALAFVQELAADGEIDAERQRSLEDGIWRTKTQRMLDYSKKIREAIKVSDLDAMRDYNQRLKRLRSVTASQNGSAETATPAGSEAPAEIVEADTQEPETAISDADASEDAATPPEIDKPDEIAENTAISEPEPDEIAEVSEPLPDDADVRGPAGGPVLGFPPTSRVAVYAPEVALETSSSSPDRVNGAQRTGVQLGNVSRGARHQTLIDDLINDLLERGDEAIAAYHLTVAPEGTDSALGIVEKLIIMGRDGEPAAENLGQKILSVYGRLVQRDISRGDYDKASAFIDRMDEVAAAAGLPRDKIDLLRAELDAAS